MIKDSGGLLWQTVTNHVRLVSWLEGGGNGNRRLGRDDDDGETDFFGGEAICLFSLSLCETAYLACHQQMAL